jgi:DUF3102 family protein
MLERMFQIGERLSRIKDQLLHGTWEQWVDEHLQFTDRTARRYLRAYKHRHDALASADPVLFLQEIQGNPEPKPKAESKTDVNVRFDEEPSNCSKRLQQQNIQRRHLHKHWIRAAADAKEAIEQLIDLQNQYRNWLEELSGESQASELGDHLLVLTQFNLEGLLSIVQEAASLELPHSGGASNGR